jgi:hypothetical protein
MAALLLGLMFPTRPEGVVKGAAIVYEAPNSTAIFNQPPPDQAENLLLTIV